MPIGCVTRGVRSMRTAAPLKPSNEHLELVKYSGSDRHVDRNFLTVTSGQHLRAAYPPGFMAGYALPVTIRMRCLSGVGSALG